MANKTMKLISEIRMHVKAAEKAIIPSEELHLEKAPFGNGGFGTVIRGKYNGTDIVVKQTWTEDERVLRLVSKEIKFLAESRHPNIVNLIGVCLDPIQPVLELVRFDLSAFGIPSATGHNLGELLQCLSANDAVHDVGIRQGVLHKCAVDTALGLAFLHSRDICHRDLKPGNVLVQTESSNINCKLTDFGEARSPQNQTSTALHDVTTDIMRGTVVFCAPEQILEDLENVDARLLKRVDVWSFGMLIFCLLNPDLKCAWQKEASLANIIKKMNKKELPEHSDKHRDVCNEIQLMDLYQRCCCYDSAKRPGIDEIVNELLRKQFKTVYAPPSASGDSRAAVSPLTAPLNPVLRNKALNTAPLNYNTSPQSASSISSVYSDAGLPTTRDRSHSEILHGTRTISSSSSADSVSYVVNDISAGAIHEQYGGVRVIGTIGDTIGEPGYIKNAWGMALYEDVLFVCDWAGQQVVAFKRHGQGDYRYLCKHEAKTPLDCVMDQKGTIYFTKFGDHSIHMLKFDRVKERLIGAGRMSVGDQLSNPKGLAFEPSGKYIYAACLEGINTVSISRNKIRTTLACPDVISTRPEAIDVMGEALMACHTFGNALLFYKDHKSGVQILRFDALRTPVGVAQDGTNFLVTDPGAHCIHVVNSQGSLVSRIKTPSMKPYTIVADKSQIFFSDQTTKHIFVLEH